MIHVRNEPYWKDFLALFIVNHGKFIHEFSEEDFNTYSHYGVKEGYTLVVEKNADPTCSPDRDTSIVKWCMDPWDVSGQLWFFYPELKHSFIKIDVLKLDRSLQGKCMLVKNSFLESIKENKQ